MRVGIIALVLVAGCTSHSPAGAQAEPRLSESSAHIAFLVDEGLRRSHVPADLQYLTDVIGPRLTGTPAMRRANDWTGARLVDYGADSVWLEGWPFGVGWQRGSLTMRLLSPHERWLQAFSWGWAPGTGGPRAGDVVFLDATTRDDFDARFAGKLTGAWVMLSRPYPRVNPDAPSREDSSRVDSLRRARNRPLTAEERSFAQDREDILAKEGISGEIIDGAKEFALVTMSGSPLGVSDYPRVVVANESYAEMHRSLAMGMRVRVEVDARNSIGRDTLVQWNTIGEIRGSERPDEVVLLGAHLDSWDLGTGATDNASGSIAVVEAARILGALKARGVRPRRTIRFALFSGEEQGLFGSRYYAAAHAEELARFQAVLVLDNGTGRITGLGLQGQDELRELWSSMLAAVDSLGPFNVRSAFKTGTDHLSFLAAGVPSFNYDQLTRGYDHTHHSQVDVYDHAAPRDVAQAATIMAVNAFQLANLPELLPRRKEGSR